MLVNMMMQTGNIDSAFSQNGIGTAAKAQGL
jgi:hypothetical protein